MAIHKFGIPALLPSHIRLVSGPGCPVCVTDIRYIDTAIAYATSKDTIIATFGDLMRVPGSASSLNEEKARGADVRVVYSSMGAVKLAQENPGKNVIFLGIGFETTAPGTAAAIIEAKKAGLSTFSVFSAHKIMPPAMKVLIDEGVKLNGYIAPGHVSTITGAKIYTFIPEKYNIPVVISGFEPLDLLQSIWMLVKQNEQNRPAVEIQYKRAVVLEGNVKAQRLLEEVFEKTDALWRGIGTIPESGLAVRNEFADFDAVRKHPVNVPLPKEVKGCICGEILKGLKEPGDCKLFGRSCTPENPVGACMVSSEGSCQAHYRYHVYG